MARKKIEPIENLGTTDKLLVQKSLPLFALWRSELTLAEFKILDTYLARIDSHHPEKRQVIFEKGELEEKLGVKKINKKELETRLIHLMGNVVKIPDIEENKGFRLVTLFEEAVAEQDDYGLWQVKLECTEKAMKYIFNIEKLGYLRYKLRCITSLKSRQAYILFTFLEANRYRTPFIVELQELKEILCCENEESYKEYKRFNDLVLKRIKKELLEKTECKFNYEPIKKGRSVVSIRFILETLPKAILEDIEEPNKEYEQENELWASALSKKNKPCEFTSEQLEEINQLLVTIPLRKLPKNTSVDDINLDRYHYLAQKFATLNRKDSEGTVRNRFSYLITMLKKDTEI